jgi:hypothetical protein
VYLRLVVRRAEWLIWKRVFSAGDEFIGSRARGLAGVGNPMIWRWVNMNHHMTLVTADLGALYGTSIATPVERRHPIQEELFTY